LRDSDVKQNTLREEDMRLHLWAAMAAMASGPVLASDISLPKQLAWTAYGTGSAGFNQSVAIGAALQEATGVNLRVLPGKNDVARTEPLRQGKVQFSATGVGGSFMAQEAVFQFGQKKWGPQPVRLLAANNGGRVGLALAVAADACERAGKPGCDGFTYADLKGMKVAWVKGAPALNVNNQAYLAYGGLTWDDVEKVEFGGFGASWAGMIDGSVDAAFASTNSGKAYEAASGPRGVYWPPIDPANEEGLARMKAIAPFFATMTATVGATIDDTPGVPTAGYAYPVLVAMDDQDADLVYNMTKAMHELFPSYDGKAPGIGGWALDKQNFEWVAPYHDGAIRYYSEIGEWSDAAQAHNDRLVARQQALRAAWDALAAENPEDWRPAWRKARRKALKAGGFEVVF
jgi:TRAP transporter TAXI family solute receptor